jgi:hypothetical protein
MADSALITRRAAIVAAAAIAAVRPVYGVMPSQTLESLAAKFRDDVMALDSRITRVWLGYDETIPGSREDRVMCVFFERPTTPFVRRRS